MYQMKKVTLFLFAFMCVAALGVKAQDYNTAIGAKFYLGNGSVGGLNIRHNSNEKTALEGSLLFYSGGVGLEGLYEYQGNIAGAAGLNYFVGGGGLLGLPTVKGGGTLFALRLTGGLDYKFPDAPINASLGFDPFFYLTPRTGSDLNIGLSLRYVLP